jgi:NADH:ubiquinone oxidoreductase subunit F (NADH-binding)
MTIAENPAKIPADTSPTHLEYLRLLAAPTTSLAEHSRRHRPLPIFERPGSFLPELEKSGLTGRGGAGFPAWRKLTAVAAGADPIVIANGAEGEPASRKDRTLLSSSPHLVLDGLQVAAETVGARQAFIYVAHPAAFAGVRAALAERQKAGTDRVPVSLVEAPDTFISGQETAVISAIEGDAALPRDAVMRVVDSGFRGRPTLVQNVETLAHLALIARRGAGWFRQCGTREEPGTFLATVSGPVVRAGIYEQPYGTTIGRVLESAGGATAPLQAVLLGGYHGTWLPLDADTWTTPMSRAGLQPYGGSVGAGVVIPLARSACGLVAAAQITDYLAGQSARQCGPCLNGLPRLADTLAALAGRQARAGLVDEVARLAAVVDGRGACRHPDGTARFVRSSLSVFRDEVSAHLAGVCTADVPS